MNDDAKYEYTLSIDATGKVTNILPASRRYPAVVVIAVEETRIAFDLPEGQDAKVGDVVHIVGHGIYLVPDESFEAAHYDLEVDTLDSFEKLTPNQP